MKCSSRKNCNLGERALGDDVAASMKCSSRKNCNSPTRGLPTKTTSTSLNEVQLSKELQPCDTVSTSLGAVLASMKCSSRKNCNPARAASPSSFTSLNEVQLSKELQQRDAFLAKKLTSASMKCSSRKNCNLSVRSPLW